MSEILREREGGGGARRKDKHLNLSSWLGSKPSSEAAPSIRPQRARREANYSRIAINKARNSGIVLPSPLPPPVPCPLITLTSAFVKGQPNLNLDPRASNEESGIKRRADSPSGCSLPSLIFYPPCISTCSQQPVCLSDYPERKSARLTVNRCLASFSFNFSSVYYFARFLLYFFFYRGRWRNE